MHRAQSARVIFGTELVLLVGAAQQDALRVVDPQAPQCLQLSLRRSALGLIVSQRRRPKATNIFTIASSGRESVSLVMNAPSIFNTSTGSSSACAKIE